MEYTEDQLTEWFCGFSPTIEGAYEVRVNGAGGIYAWWSKESGWGAASGSTIGASGGMHRGGSKDHFHVVGEWRGLNFNPQAPQNPPKKQGNKRKKVYVVFDSNYEKTKKVCVGCYAVKKNAEIKAESVPYGFIQELRFRTPEA